MEAGGEWDSKSGWAAKIPSDPTSWLTENDGSDRRYTSDHPTDDDPNPAPFYSTFDPLDPIPHPHTRHPLIMHTKRTRPHQTPLDQDLAIPSALEIVKDLSPSKRTAVCILQLS
jgi:hypothetical protein